MLLRYMAVLQNRDIWLRLSLKLGEAQQARLAPLRTINFTLECSMGSTFQACSVAIDG